MADPNPNAPGAMRIAQGHPTGLEPSANKGGQNGSPKPDGRAATPSNDLPDSGADAAATPDNPGRGGD